MLKKILPFLFALVLISSCNLTKKATDFYNAKCGGSYIKQRPDGRYDVNIKCSNLYNAAGVQKYISSGSINFDIANSTLSITGVSKDSLPNVIGIAEEIVKGLKK